MPTTTVSKQTLRRYSDAVTRLATQPKGNLLIALQSLEWQDVTADANRAVAIMQAASGSGSNLAAVASAEFYKSLRHAAIGGKYPAIAVSGWVPEATEGAVRSFVWDVIDGNRDVFESKCLDRYEYDVRNSAKRCIGYNAQRDPARVRYAVVPSGECCDFCAMLASRGFVYHDADSCEDIHPHCTCSAVPDFAEVKGYDPESYYERYLEGPFA